MGTTGREREGRGREKRERERSDDDGGISLGLRGNPPKVGVRGGEKGGRAVWM